MFYYCLCAVAVPLCNCTGVELCLQLSSSHTQTLLAIHFLNIAPTIRYSTNQMNLFALFKANININKS